MENIKERMASKALPTVILTIFLDVLGVGILIPIIPQLLANPHSAYYLLPAGWTFKGGLILLGWLLAIYPFMQFLSTPILGQLSDRFGRKKVLGFSIFGTSIGYVLFAIGIITRNLPLLFFSRALDGITGGNLSVAQAVIADVTPPKDRAKRFALIGAAFGMGFVLGPYLGAKLGSPGISVFGLFHTPHWFNPATPFWFTAGLSAINLLLVLFLLPETHEHIRQVKIKLTQSVHNIVTAASYPGLRIIFPSVFLFWGGFSFFQTFFQVLLIDKLHFTQNNVGDFFAFIGIWIAITQAIITPLLAKRFKPFQVLRVSLIGSGLSLFGFLLANNTTQLLLVVPIFAIFLGNSIANSIALVSISADKKIQGEVLGINASVQALAQTIPAALSGYLAVVSINTPVLAGGFTVIAGGLIFLMIYRPPAHLLHQDMTHQTAPVTH
ncbi:MAG: tetracycline resistance efflux pump [Candidatus Saccharibacteria bacterium]|nr:tetracycline resistance efflux pump [Candidatus Saccharibacteria bacterium]